MQNFKSVQADAAGDNMEERMAVSFENAILKSNTKF